MKSIFLSKVIILIYIEEEELCEFVIDTNNLNPRVDPLTIIAIIINTLNIDIVDIFIIIIIKIDKINISNLSKIRIKFFRHHNILSRLTITIIFIKLIY